MAERIDERTEREIEALLNKLIVEKVCSSVEASVKSQGQTLQKKLQSERESVESTLNFQIGGVMDEFGELKSSLKEEMATLSNNTHRQEEQLTALSQDNRQKGEQLTEQLDAAAEALNGWGQENRTQLERLRELLDGQRIQAAAFDEAMCRKADDLKAALEREIRNAVQTVLEQEEVSRARAAECQEEGWTRWECLFREVENKLMNLRRMVLVLLGAQVVWGVLAIIQLIH